MTKEITPKFKERIFTCPNCSANTQQNWSSEVTEFHEYTGVYIVKCEVCENNSIWLDEKMLFPKVAKGQMPHPDMPVDTKELYEEARLVSTDSPRAAAALLRVSLEKLTEHLGESEGTLNSRIGKLQSKGLPKKVIQSLDIVRVNGNEGGSHSGQIDFEDNDNADVVDKLFWLVNYIIEKVITENAEIDNQFSKLPSEKIQGIKDRDSSL